MEACSGTRELPHPEIVHDEGSSSCPLCESKTEMREFDKVNTRLSAENEALKDENKTISETLSALRKALDEKGLAWAIEPIKEAPHE